MVQTRRIGVCMNQESEKSLKELIDEKLEQIKKDCYERNLLPVAMVAMSNGHFDDGTKKLTYISYNNKTLPFDYICQDIKTVRLYNGNTTDNSMTFVDSFWYEKKPEQPKQEIPPTTTSKPEPTSENKPLTRWQRFKTIMSGCYVKG